MVDHNITENLWKGKKEPMTNRLKVLFLKLEDYTFDLKYQQGKKTFIITTLSLLHIETPDDVHDVITLSSLWYLIQHTSINIINIWHLHYTSILHNNMYK